MDLFTFLKKFKLIITIGCLLGALIVITTFLGKIDEKSKEKPHSTALNQTQKVTDESQNLTKKESKVQLIENIQNTDNKTQELEGDPTQLIENKKETNLNDKVILKKRITLEKIKKPKVIKKKIPKKIVRKSRVKKILKKEKIEPKKNLIDLGIQNTREDAADAKLISPALSQSVKVEKFKKRYSGIFDTSTNFKPVYFENPGVYNRFVMGLSYKLNNKFNISTTQVVDKAFYDERKLTIWNTKFALKPKAYKIPYLGVNVSTSFDLYVPTSRLTDESSIMGQVQIPLRLSKQFGPISTTYGFTYRKYLYKYTHNKNGSSNTNHRIINAFVVSASLPYGFSVSSEFDWWFYFPYVGRVRNYFVVDFNIEYSILDNLSARIGVSTLDNALKNNTKYNLAVFRKDVTEMYLGISYIF